MYDNDCWTGDNPTEQEAQTEQPFAGQYSWSYKQYGDDCALTVKYDIVPGVEDGSTFDFKLTNNGRSRAYFYVSVDYYDKWGEKLDSDLPIHGIPKLSPSKTETVKKTGTAPQQSKSVKFRPRCY